MEEDIIVTALKERYFNLIKKEDIPKTPAITNELDKIEKTIREFKKTDDKLV